MNILVLTARWSPDTFGGSERVARAQVESLRRMGHRIVVLAHNHGSFPAHEKMPWGEVIRYGGTRGARLMGQTMTDTFYGVRAIRRLCAREVFDCVIAHHPFIADAYLRHIPRSSTPFLYCFHASTAMEAMVEGTRRFGRWGANMFVGAAMRTETRVLRRAHAIGVLSAYSQQILEEVFSVSPIPVVRVKHAFEVVLVNSAQKLAARKKLGIPPDEVVFITVRRLAPRMGIDMLLDAWYRFSLTHTNVRLLLVGQGGMQEALMERVARYGITSTVRFMGAVSDTAKQDLLYASDCFVLPTKWYEGFGLATAEALGVGLPVLGTSVGATPELLGHIHRDLLIKEPTPAGVEERLEWFYEHRNELGDISRACRDFIATEYNQRVVDDTLRAWVHAGFEYYAGTSHK